MNETLQQLQAKYASAVYLAERYTREAELTKKLLDELADQEARAGFAPVKAKRAVGKAGK